MSAPTPTLTAVTELVRACLEAVPIDQLIIQPTQNSVRQMIDKLSGFASHFSSSKFGECHGYLLLVLSKSKMRLVMGEANLDCARITTPARINPAIADTTSGRALLQLQEEQEV